MPIGIGAWAVVCVLEFAEDGRSAEVEQIPPPLGAEGRDQRVGMTSGKGLEVEGSKAGEAVNS